MFNAIKLQIKIHFKKATRIKGLQCNKDLSALPHPSSVPQNSSHSFPFVITSITSKKLLILLFFDLST